MRRPSTPERDGNLHIHISLKYVDGTYHDGWHPVTRMHAHATEEGKELHYTHQQEIIEEKKQEERAIQATFSGKCSVCSEVIPIGCDVWWSRVGLGIRHRGAGTCDERVPEDVPQRDTPSVDLGDVQEKIDEATRGMREQVVTIQKRLLDAEEDAKLTKKYIKETEAKVNKAQRIEIVTRKTPEDKKPKVKKLKAKQHESFPQLLKKMAAGINVVMVGDAGSGKTVAPSIAARILGRKFYHIPLGPQTSKSDLLGYMNGAGKYVYSLLCQVYEYGGIGLLDEMDAANPATLTIINGMLEALEAGFADKMRRRHPDCSFVAAMNTYGRGADMMYVGRAQLDAATLNRWYYLEWNTDWDLTRAIVKNDNWVNRVEALYQSASRQKIRATIGMRTAIMGQKAMDNGDTPEEAEHGVIWAPMKPDDKQKILAEVSSSTDGGES